MRDNLVVDTFEGSRRLDSNAVFITKAVSEVFISQLMHYVIKSDKSSNELYRQLIKHLHGNASLLN